MAWKRINFEDCDKTIDALLLESDVLDGRPRVDIVLTGIAAYFCNPGEYSASKAVGMINFLQAGKDARLSGNKIISDKKEIGYVANKQALHMARTTAAAYRKQFCSSQELSRVFNILLALAEKHPVLRYNKQHHYRREWEEINKRRGERIF